jgi:AsmA family
MTDGSERKAKTHGRLRVALAAIAVLAALLVVPPFINVNHYKARITQLISRSLGRPVRLSSVQIRLLPWPGFELTDLSVAEDPAYGAEPVLHANSVVASIRLLALLRGRIEIGKISVDEASLNLVRAVPGRWNLDPLFRTAAAQTGSTSAAGHAAPLPYLEATDSRIDFKNGVEKLPFSLVNADLSFWQEGSGEWRIRLRGQPARTDVSLYQEETGVVRVEASVRRAPALRLMPLHLDLDWRQAQLGQLARIITGSDPGWRGDLTGELHLDGTADSAQISMRLRASGVHRAEFTPESPLDFDASCSLVYHYAQRSLQNLACDSPLGDGHVHIAGEKPGEDAPPQFSVALDRIPLAAGLDVLRTFRSGFAPTLEANGTVSGKIIYATGETADAEPRVLTKSAKNRPGKPASQQSGPLTGNLIVSNLILRGGNLDHPIQSQRITLEPVAAAEGSPPAISGTFPVPAGEVTPLTFNVRFSLSGYRVGVRGQASFARARELAQAAGIPETTILTDLAGDPMSVDLIAAGPWIPPEEFSLAGGSLARAMSAGIPASQAAAAPQGSATATLPTRDTLTGTVSIHDANWKADYLASHVIIDQATLHLDGINLRWDPVEFNYGPLKGTATITAPLHCPSDQPVPQPCPAIFQMHFTDLDAAAFETALLGAHEKSTLLSDLIERFHPSSAPPWPRLDGTVAADSLVLEPVTLHKATISVRILPDSAEITNFDAALLGGTVHATGRLDKPATDQDKPDYSFDVDCRKLSAPNVGALLGLRWAGGAFDVGGHIELSGYSDRDLAASAKGTLHFDWRRGAIGNQPSANLKAAPIPKLLGRFDRWTGDAAIANGAITLGQNQVVSGARKQPVNATVTFGDPPIVSFAAGKSAPAKH